MWKKRIILLIFMLLIATAVLPAIDTFEINRKSAISFRFKSIINPNPSYMPVDIDLEDAAYHKSSGRYHLEWWYFEGIFDNGYSIVLAIILVSKGCKGQCVFGFHVYKDTELEISLNKKVNIEEFEASEVFPFIMIFGKQVIRLDRERYNSTGEWVYNVSFEIDNQEANLQFTGVTKGFKGEILRGWYGPVLPKATVNGTLNLNGKKIDVSGLGYHEHGCEIPFPIWEWGWDWSKIVSDSYTVVWAKMMNTRWWEQTRAAIFSQDQGGFININPDKIKLKATKYKFDNWRIIPTKFVLNITDHDNHIYVNTTMETINTHHIGIYRIIHYWKYHIKVNGEITYDSITEIIKDEIQVLEMTRFR